MSFCHFRQEKGCVITEGESSAGNIKTTSIAQHLQKMNFKIHLCKSMQGYCKIVKVKKFVKSRSIYMLKTFRSQLDL